MNIKKGFHSYKKYWEDQASFMDKSPWSFKKILKLTISSNFSEDIEQLEFSNHSISKERGKLTLRLTIPYNYFELDDFESKSIELLGIDKNWLINMSLEDSHCTHKLTK